MQAGLGKTCNGSAKQELVESLQNADVNQNNAVAVNSLTFLNASMLAPTQSYGGRVVERLSCAKGLPRLRNQCMSLVVAGMGSNPIRSNFSDNQRLIQIETLCLLIFLKNLEYMVRLQK